MPEIKKEEEENIKIPINQKNSEEKIIGKRLKVEPSPHISLTKA